MNQILDTTHDQQSSSPHDPVSSANVLTASGELDLRKLQTELRLPDGRIVRVPTSLFSPGFEAGHAAQIAPAGTVIPVIEEHLSVGKRTVITGKVLLEKHTQEYHETLDVPLAVRTFDIERVVLNQPIEAPPAVRQEGDTTIYPLIEEQLVLTTQLILKEELRVTRRDTERRDTRTVTLKRESVTITRSSVAPGAEQQAGQE